MKISWPTKRLMMAEIYNEPDGEDSPATLRSALDHICSGYDPYDDFPFQKVEREINLLAMFAGPDCRLERFLTDVDWSCRLAGRKEEPIPAAPQGSKGMPLLERYRLALENARALLGDIANNSTKLSWQDFEVMARLGERRIVEALSLGEESSK